MRCRRFLLAAGLLWVLLLLPTPADAEDKHFGLHGMSCTGITAMGEGLPASRPLHLALVDPDEGETLVERTVRTSSKGAFETRLEAGLQQRLTVRLQVTAPGGERIGSAQHAMARGAPMCDLPFTGLSSTAVLLTAGLLLLGLGGGVLLLSARRARPPAADA
jgi:hypothetical protein